MRVIALRQGIIADGLRTANTLRHVLARHLEMHTACISPFGLVDFKHRTHFAQNLVEGTRLVSARRLDGLSVHRIAGPYDFTSFSFDGADQTRQVFLHIAVSHA